MKIEISEFMTAKIVRYGTTDYYICTCCETKLIRQNLRQRKKVR